MCPFCPPLPDLPMVLMAWGKKERKKERKGDCPKVKSVRQHIFIVGNRIHVQIMKSIVRAWNG